MKIHVRFFSFLCELTGHSEMFIVVPEAANVDLLLGLLADRYPGFREVRRCLLIAVRLEYQTKEYTLTDGDEVSLFPPVQGG